MGDFSEAPMKFVTVTPVEIGKICCIRVSALLQTPQHSTGAAFLFS